MRLIDRINCFFGAHRWGYIPYHPEHPFKRRQCLTCFVIQHTHDDKHWRDGDA